MCWFRELQSAAHAAHGFRVCSAETASTVAGVRLDDSCEPKNKPVPTRPTPLQQSALLAGTRVAAGAMICRIALIEEAASLPSQKTHSQRFSSLHSAARCEGGGASLVTREPPAFERGTPSFHSGAAAEEERRGRAQWCALSFSDPPRCVRAEGGGRSRVHRPVWGGGAVAARGRELRRALARRVSELSGAATAGARVVLR